MQRNSIGAPSPARVTLPNDLSGSLKYLDDAQLNRLLEAVTVVWANRALLDEGPMVRIRLSPAVSQANFRIAGLPPLVTRTACAASDYRAQFSRTSARMPVSFPLRPVVKHHRLVRLIRARAHTNPLRRSFVFSSKFGTAAVELVGEDGAQNQGVTKK